MLILNTFAIVTYIMVTIQSTLLNSTSLTDTRLFWGLGAGVTVKKNSVPSFYDPHCIFFRGPNANKLTKHMYKIWVDFKL